MRYLPLVLSVLLVGCSPKQSPSSVVAPVLATYTTMPLQQIPEIKVREGELDLTTLVGVRDETLLSVTEINGGFYPKGTHLRYESWLDAQKAKYLIVVICDYSCDFVGPPPPGHDYDPDCTDPNAWVTKRFTMGDPDIGPSKIHLIVTDPNCMYADGDGAVVKTAAIGDPTADDAPRH